MSIRKALPRSPDLHYLRRTYPNRWSAATIAAALTLPAHARDTAEEWAEMLDRIDVALHEIVGC